MSRRSKGMTRRTEGSDTAQSGRGYTARFVQNCLWMVPCVAATVLYFRSLGYSFIRDDRTQILFNPQVQSWTYLPRLLTTHVWSQRAAETLVPLYRPVCSVWLLLVYSVAGSTEWVWHAVSLALYVLTIYLVYCLSEELLKHRLAAAVTALVFAVHPIHIEAVCWISACNELLIGPLIAISVWLFIRQLRLKAHSIWSYSTVLSLLAWTGALFAKESVLLLVGIFPYAAWRLTTRELSFKPRIKDVAQKSSLYVVATLFYLCVRLSVLGKAIPYTGSHTWRQVAFTATSLFTFYMQKLVLPTGLSSFYVTPIVSSASLKMWMEIGVAGSALSLVAGLSRRYYEIGMAALLLVGPLIPVILALRVFVEGDAAHDRYLFIPSMGLSLLVGIAVRPLLQMSDVVRNLVLTAIAVAVVSFTVLTVTQEGYYRDEKAYFGPALQVNAKNVLVMDYLGDSYMRDSQMPEALQLFERAHAIAPADPNTTYCLARGLYNNKQYVVAEPLLEDVATEPDLPPLRRFVGGMLLAKVELALQRPDRARSILTGLVAEDPLAADTHFMLGSMDEVEGHFADARSEYLSEYKISGNALAGERALTLSGRLAKSGAPKAF